MKITDEQFQGISDRLCELLWPHNHLRRDDPQGEEELIVADAAKLSTKLLGFIVNEAVTLSKEADRE